MKISVAVLGMIGLLIMSTRIAKASNGNPFEMTVLSGGFIDGEPNSTYTASGMPPTAYVQVGGSGSFSCYNTAGVTKTAATQAYTYTNLRSGSFPPTLSAITNPATSYNGPMLAMQTLYYGASDVASGPVAHGSYTANCTMSIYDSNTADEA